jgi:hypothetical protein
MKIAILATILAATQAAPMILPAPIMAALMRHGNVVTINELVDGRGREVAEVIEIDIGPLKHAPHAVPVRKQPSVANVLGQVESELENTLVNIMKKTESLVERGPKAPIMFFDQLAKLISGIGSQKNHLKPEVAEMECEEWEQDIPEPSAALKDHFDFKVQL